MNEGMIIKFLRKERKMSQTELAEGICSVRHLGNIEAGRNSPTYTIVEEIVNRLGTDLSLILNKDIQRYGLNFYKMFKEAEALFDQWDYSQLLELVESILDEYTLDSFINRKLIYYRGICISELHGNYEIANSILLKALNLEEIEEIETALLTYRDSIELDIINAISVNLSRKGKTEASYSLFCQIRKNIVKYEGMETSFGVKILYNLVKEEYVLGLEDKCLETAEECVTLCKKLKHYKHLPDTYYYIAKITKKRGGAYQTYYKKCLYLYELFGEHSKAEFVAHRNDDVINIDLDEDILEAEI